MKRNDWPALITSYIESRIRRILKKTYYLIFFLFIGQTFDKLAADIQM